MIDAEGPELPVVPHAAAVTAQSSQSLQSEPRQVLVDPKILKTPDAYTGEDQDWPDWKFIFMNSLGAISPRMAILMPPAEAEDDPVQDSKGGEVF